MLGLLCSEVFMLNKRLLGTLGLVLFSISAHGNIRNLNGKSNEEQVQAAQVIEALIDRGFIEIDQDGNMRIKQSIFEILKSYDMTNEIDGANKISQCSSSKSGNTLQTMDDLKSRPGIM